jgi:quercetin dioxygenase-like cupin family protein
MEGVMTAMREQERAHLGRGGPPFYEQALAAAQALAREDAGKRTIIPAEEMVWEEARQGRIKHMVNAGMNTKEYCLDIYQQLLAPGERSGKHRHFSEEVLYVLEGEGADLHWDVTFDCADEYEWAWEDEPKRFEWRAGDFVYIPPYAIHQHLAGSTGARFISITARVVKAMGFDGLEQLEDAPGYHPAAGAARAQ